jgi:hypothetical protein
VLTRRRAVVMSACAAGLMMTASALAAPPARAGQTLQPSRAAYPEQQGTVTTTSPVPPGAALTLAKEILRAWQITKGGGALVAVLSSGVVPVGGLSGKVLQGPDYAPVRHPVKLDGTVLASLIAANGPTSASPTRAVGGAPASRILSERIVDYESADARQYQQAGTWEQIESEAIRYAVNHGADVIAIRESGTVETPGLAAAVSYAVAHRVVVITGGTYFGKGRYVTYPDDLPGVINVSGVTLAGLPPPRGRLHFAADESILLAAPANVLLGIGPNGEAEYAWGDFSTEAWTAATVALIKSVYPRIPVALVARALASSASYHPAGGYNTRIGFGVINPIGALMAARTLLKLRPTAVPGPRVEDPSAHFSHEQVGGVIDAVRHSPVTLAGFSGVIIAGFLLLMVAFRLARRSRRHPAAEDLAIRVP